MKKSILENRLSDYLPATESKDKKSLSIQIIPKESIDKKPFSQSKNKLNTENK